MSQHGIRTPQCGSPDCVSALAGFLTVLIWRAARPRCRSRSGNPRRGNRWQKGWVGARGGFEELLRKSRPRLAPKFVQHRVGDPRLISLIRRWLKAGVLEEGVVTRSEMGTPQGGSSTPRTQKVT